MPQVNSEGVTTQLVRAYNSRGPLTPSGAVGISPIVVVGAGAHPSIASHPRGVVSLTVIAGAAVTGGAGLIVPSTLSSGVVVVVTGMSASASAAAILSVLLDGPTAEADYPPGGFTSNLNIQNNVRNTTPFVWQFSSTTTTPAVGLQIGSVSVPAAGYSQYAITPLVLIPGWGIVVKPNVNNITFSVDIAFEVFEKTPS